MKELLIFDFDGVLADSEKFWIKVIKQASKECKIFNKKIEQKVIQRLGEKVSFVFKDSGFSSEKANDFDKKALQISKEKADKIKTVKEIQYIKKLKQNKILISNCYSGVLDKILKKNKISFFKEVYGKESFVKKEDLIKKIIKKNNIKKENVFYIGDKVIDIKISKNVKCNGIIVLKYSWDNKKQILKNSPDIILSDLKELYNLFKTNK
jgi:phosphoglycolate phosphatase